MNSTERRQARYLRHRDRREKKRQKFIDTLPRYDDVFTYRNLYDAFSLCKNGVMWKSSIQSYQINLPVNIYDIFERLRNCTYKSRGFVNFKICERGKMRNIQSVHISERCVQRCLCDHYLIPLMSHNLIYDNGASIKGKGTDFCLKRLKKHLTDHYMKYGNEGYILLYDFSNYFGNIDHEALYGITDKLITDERLNKLYHQFIDAFDTGLGLGSQISQISAVTFANRIDHMFKDKMGIKGYGRYMDDGYIIANNLATINKCKDALNKACMELKITINPNKMKVCKLKSTFTFLKKRISLKSSGKVVMRLSRKNIKSARKRLYKLRELLDAGRVTLENVEQAYRSWRYSVKKYKNYKSIIQLDNLYNSLFVEPFRYGGAYGL